MLQPLRRLLAFVRRDRLDVELREEIEAHLELRRRQLIEGGLEPERAAQEARRAFGNVMRVRENARALWSIGLLDALAQDLRHGARVIARTPGFSAVAIISLAVGIGAATVLFSFANAWLFRPLAVADPRAVVQVFTSGFEGSVRGGNSYPDFEDFGRTGVFSGLAASMAVQATLTEGDRSDVLSGLLVSPGYFEVLGLEPARGRLFNSREIEAAEHEPVVVLSHDAWRRRFAADPGIVGGTIRINARPLTLIGIGPERFSGTSFDHAAEFFLPATMHGALAAGARDVTRDRRLRAFTVLGRLEDGKPLPEARAALDVLGTQLFRQYPEAWRNRAGRGRSITVMPELSARNSQVDAFVVLGGLLGAVVLLVGIACVNVATVLLARATARRKEMAVRLALGASRGRVVRQLLTECVLLAAAGGLAGTLIAQSCAVAFISFRPDEVPPFNLTVDYRVALFSVAASLLAVVFFGLAPALQATRGDVNGGLKDREPVLRTSWCRFGLRDLLVVVQIAASLALVLGAALMARSLRAVGTEDLGFRRDGVINIGVDVSTIGPDGAARRFVPDALRAVSDLPGVKGAAFAALVPLDGSNHTLGIEVRQDGRAAAETIDGNTITAGYFQLLGLPLLQGREFTDADGSASPFVAIVNETLARRFWGSRPLGGTFYDTGTKRTVEVIGVVRDFRTRSFAERPRPMAWFPAGQRSMHRMTLHLSTGESPAVIGPAVRERLRAIAPAAGLTRATTMDDYLEFITIPQRISGAAAAALGVLELLLAAMALYGVIAFTVARRTREIGIRVALGASASSVARLIMRDGCVLALAGVGLGLIVSVAAAPALASLLIGVGPADPISIAGTAAVILGVAVAASYVPARRALRVDPSAALRTE
jgi:predicted permease